jgi:hypothetical protein
VIFTIMAYTIISVSRRRRRRGRGRGRGRRRILSRDE